MKLVLMSIDLSRVEKRAPRRSRHKFACHRRTLRIGHNAAGIAKKSAHASFDQTDMRLTLNLTLIVATPHTLCPI